MQVCLVAALCTDNRVHRGVQGNAMSSNESNDRSCRPILIESVACDGRPKGKKSQSIDTNVENCIVSLRLIIYSSIISSISYNTLFTDRGVTIYCFATKD